MHQFQISEHHVYLSNYKRTILHLKRKWARFKREFCWNLLLAIVLIILISIIVLVSNLVNIPNRLFVGEPHKIDWHNWELIEAEKLRFGLGEHGEAAYLWYYPPSTRKINDTHGYNGYLSDRIALNRSLKDLRPNEYVRDARYPFFPHHWHSYVAFSKYFDSF